MDAYNKKELNRLYSRDKAELVAIYGRRRVGKTYLVDETFADRITFRHAGLSPADEASKGLLKLQLNHFYNSLELQGMEKCDKPTNWLDAFLLLEKFLQSKDNGSRQVVFLDELPWLDTPKSGFIRAFEAFWNTWGCHRKNLMVIVCGSANSWIQDKLLDNHGGLYNRVTYEIKLSPFNLKECEDFYKSNNVILSRYDVAQSYMVLGGIPYYMSYVNPEMSLAQNIDNMFFKKNAILRDEYNRLFASVSIWRGFAFENVCFNHVEQIKRSLGISGVITEASAWSKKEDDTDGTQIDLLISRNDNVINMCEIKYYSGEFKVNRDYYLKLLKRQTILAENVSPKVAIHSTLITTFGLMQNEYSGAFSNVLVLDDLFREE